MPAVKLTKAAIAKLKDGISRGDPAMARQCYPGSHRGAWQGRGFLEGEVALQRHDTFLAQYGVFREHAVALSDRDHRL